MPFVRTGFRLETNRKPGSKTMKNAALLAVDVQNDFCPGGALAVPCGDEIVPVLNKYIAEFSERGLPVFFSRDWHPPSTRHFAEYGGKWPPHCVRNTRGAAFHSGLRIPGEAVIISKGMEPGSEGYSAFEAVDSGGVPLPELLKDLNVSELFIGGLAADYCVRATVLESLKNGFRTYLLEDATRGVEVEPGDTKKAVEEMSEAGAVKIDFDKFREISGG